MSCKNCNLKPVHQLTSGVKLCRSCFIKYFEKKVRKTVRVHKLIQKKDKVCVAISGGKDSLTVLNILKDFNTIEVFALLIDEGIKGYREHTIKDAREFCEKNNIPLHIVSFKEELGYTLDEMIKILNMKPCTVCGVFRRYLLNKASRELNATKLATGHNMDDEAQSIIMNQFKRKLDISARLGPITGVKDDPRFIRRIKPLYMMSEKEVGIYAFLKGLMRGFNECPYENESFRSDVRDMLNDFEQKYHGTKNNIINSFLEILPLLKAKYRSSKEIKECSICKEPCTSEICKACELKLKLKK
ncbi:TIGR00269 family protein [Candidatus Woesearchaeota archaeon]|nr:MAG: TIGR00269 family protein [Candidatus Woesearchaeota archaeon]